MTDVTQNTFYIKQMEFNYFNERHIFSRSSGREKKEMLGEKMESTTKKSSSSCFYDFTNEK